MNPARVQPWLACRRFSPAPPPAKLRWFEAPIPAGFPSPAEDYLENPLDLTRYLVRHPAATFLMRMTGEALRADGIEPGDVLVVDRSLSPANGQLVVAVVAGELVVRRFCRPWRPRPPASAGTSHPAGGSEPETEWNVWGVVVGLVRRLA